MQILTLRNNDIPNCVWHYSACFLQFPILGDRDSFVDGHGPHKTDGEIKIPIQPGPQAYSGPFTVLQHWLQSHIPDLSLPVDLGRMSAEDRSNLFSKIFIDVEGGKKLRLIDILGPILQQPDWKGLNVESLKLPQDLLRLPVKRMFIEVSHSQKQVHENFCKVACFYTVIVKEFNAICTFCFCRVPCNL